MPAILSAPYYLDQTQSYRMGSGQTTLNARARVQSTLADPGFPSRDCGTKIGHIDEIWKCFYSASPDDGVEDKVAAWNTSLVLGGVACLW